MSGTRTTTTQSTTLINNYIEGKELETEGNLRSHAGLCEFSLGGMTLTALGIHMLAIAHPHITAAALVGHAIVAGIGGTLTLDGVIRMREGRALSEMGSDFCTYAMNKAKKSGMTLFTRKATVANNEVTVIAATPAPTAG
jgi:hypothetical protein